MSSLSDQVYNLLYDKSCLSDGNIGVRVCHEDEWPIDEIVMLIHEESRDALAQGREFVEQAKIEYYNLGYKDAEAKYAK